jgi:hypothetical protein
MVKSVDQLQDFKGTIEELSRIINFLKEDYGGDTLIYFDAGYNNVDVVIETKDKMYGD